MTTTSLLVLLSALAGQNQDVQFDADALFTYDCESFNDVVTVRASSADVDAVEGAGALRLGDNDALSFSLQTPAERRLRFRAWALPDGALPFLSVSSFSVDAAGAFFAGTTELSSQPTGRVRSDGWVELETVHNVVASDADVRVDFAVFPAFGVDLDGVGFDAAIDAISVVDEGAVDVAGVGAACSVYDEEATCGDALLCNDGACARPFTRTSDELRRHLVARRAFEVRAMSGPRTPVRDVDAVADAIAALADDDGAHFATHLDRALSGYGDGHASASAASAGTRANNRACLEPARVVVDGVDQVLPIVWSVAPSETVVQPGDIVVAIDGRDPATWALEAGRGLFAPVRPEAIAGLVTRSLWLNLSTISAAVRLLRCDDDACAAPVFVDVDAGDAPVDNTPCTPLVGFSSDIAFVDRDDIRVVSVHSYPLNADAFLAVLDEIARTPLLGGGAPRGIVLDQREGFGGFNSSALPLVATFFAADEDPRFIPVSRADDDVIDGILAACARAVPCPRDFFLARDVDGAYADVPLAVIVGNSTSNSEVTTELLRLRRAPTRVFGFGPTSGGFGSIAAFDSLGAGFGGQHQAFDGAFARAGETVTHTALRAGIGTVPDVEALVRRGDVLTQRDAALEAALSWVRTELER